MTAADLIAWRDPRRRETYVATALSALLHLLLILVVATILTFRLPAPAPKVDSTDEPPEFTLIAPPLEPVSEKPSYVATSVTQEVDKPTERAAFESDKNTAAASELPADGNLPVPTQEGITAPGLDFEDRRFTTGPGADQANRPPTEASKPSQPSPATETVESTADTTKQARPVPTPRTTAPVALLDPPAPQRKAAQPAAQSGYQPETRITKLRGNISNRGRASVAANATPLGRFKKQVSDAIGSRWHYYVKDQVGLVSVGTVEIAFVLREDGTVERAKVTSNSSNESLAACSLQSIMDAELPPIPDELVTMIPNRRLEIEFTFTVLSN